MKKELNGIISENYEYGEIMIGSDIVTEAIGEFDGEQCKLTYYISDSEIQPDKAVENFLRTFYEGKTNIDDGYIHGSSWTGVYARNDMVAIGGHDINKELIEHLGKYCYLVLTILD